MKDTKYYTKLIIALGEALRYDRSKARWADEFTQLIVTSMETGQPIDNSFFNYLEICNTCIKLDDRCECEDE